MILSFSVLYLTKSSKLIRELGLDFFLGLYFLYCMEYNMERFCLCSQIVRKVNGYSCFKGLKIVVKEPV